MVHPVRPTPGSYGCGEWEGGTINALKPERSSWQIAAVK